MLSFKDLLCERKELKPKKVFYEVLDKREVRDALVKRNLSRITAVEIIKKVEKAFDCTFKDVSDPVAHMWWRTTNSTDPPRYYEDEIRLGSDSKSNLTFVFSKNVAVTVFSRHLVLGILSVNRNYFDSHEIAYQSHITLNRIQLLHSSLEKEREILEQCVSLVKKISEMKHIELLALSDWLAKRSNYYGKPSQKIQSTNSKRQASGTYKFGRLTMQLYEFSDESNNLNPLVHFKVNGVGDKELRAIEASLPKIFHEIRGQITGSISGIL